MSTDNDSRGQMTRNRSNAGADAKRRKKPYASPKLVLYGDVGAITQNVGMKMMKDGGAKPNNKSSIT